MPIRLKDVWLMVEAPKVREVLGRQRWLTVPGTAAHLPGVCAWRGRAIPVLNLAPLLGLTQDGTDAWERTLIVDCNNNVAAIPVSEAQAVVFVKREHQRAPEVNAHRYCRAEVDSGEALASIVDLDALFQDLLGQADGAVTNA
jgi:chemotaxis signal transduction protein